MVSNSIAMTKGKYVTSVLCVYDYLSIAHSRFEEVTEDIKTAELKTINSSKRPRESDAMEPSKNEKKQNKKLKAEGGLPVAAGTEAPAESSEKKKDKKDKKKEKKEGGGANEKRGIDAKSEVKTKEIAGGIKIKDSKVGTGPQAKKGDTVSMRYIGKLENGKIFDKNTKGKPVCSSST
jgi:FK506-binding nuclear protein